MEHQFIEKDFKFDETDAKNLQYLLSLSEEEAVKFADSSSDIVVDYCNTLLLWYYENLIQKLTESMKRLTLTALAHRLVMAEKSNQLMKDEPVTGLDEAKDFLDKFMKK